MSSALSTFSTTASMRPGGLRFVGLISASQPLQHVEHLAANEHASAHRAVVDGRRDQRARREPRARADVEIVPVVRRYFVSIIEAMSESDVTICSGTA